MGDPDWYAIGERAKANYAVACARLERLQPGIDVDGFVNAATGAGPYETYKHLGAAARGMVAYVHTHHGPSAVHVFLRAALERAICINVEQGTYKKLPPLCAKYHALQLMRIAVDTTADASWLEIGHDIFQKEWGIVSLRLYVAASNLVDPRCGIPRSILWRDGLANVPRRLRMIWRLGGFKPWLQGHLHTFMLAALNEDGREDFYRCCVELFELHPEMLGMFCSSWYYDPALDTISPRLSYLRSVPLAGGARLMRTETGGEAVANATAKSPTRRRLYEAGKYVPKTYMFIWGRRDMEQWSRTHPRADPSQ